jgi:DNA (cytosine-5)-methyltransferase 1
MRYLSLFSGIEATTRAWHELGFKPVAFAEIEKFPCDVLAHHYPHVPNLGDVTKITERDIAALGPIDIVVFGSPCQDLSVAGGRKGLLDDSGNITRSGLFFTAINIFQWARKHCGCRFALWENVPGAYSSNKGRDFAAVVSHMAGLDDVAVPKNGWGTEGAAVGDHGLLEWACLDAQWFGVAQRRRRVFAILDTGDWTSRPPILLEPHSLRGDSAPSRKKREEITHDVAPCLTSSGRGVERNGESRGQDPVVALSVALRGRDGGATAELGDDVGFTLRASGGGGDKPHVLCFGGNNTSRQIDVSPALNAHGGPVGRLDFEPECFVIQAGALRTNPNSGPGGIGVQSGVAYTLEARAEVQAVCLTGDVAHTLKAEGFDGSEDGTGRGTPIIAFPGRMSGTQYASTEDLSPSLGARNPMSVSFRAAGQDGFVPDVIAPPICSSTGGGSGVPATQYGMVVRRLTPRECERLQGFRDDFTLIPVKGKIAADGPRYKVLGNSMAVPVMKHIGQKIVAAVELGK